MRKRLGRVDFRKGFWDCYKGQGKISQCHDGDDNEIAKKTIVCKCIQLFYIYFFPLLYDYDGKMPNFTFYGGRKQATAKFSFSFWTWIWFLGIWRKKSSLVFDKRLKERKFTFQATFSWPSRYVTLPNSWPAHPQYPQKQLRGAFRLQVPPRFSSGELEYPEASGGIVMPGVRTSQSSRGAQKKSSSPLLPASYAG